MPISQLPERASLEYLKKLAKERLTQLRGGDPRAKLAAALLDVARQHGFPSWRALRGEVDHRRKQIILRFFSACSTGDVNTVRTVLVDEPAFSRMSDPKGEHHGWTGLHHAARSGHLEVLRVLLGHGADPNAREAGDNTSPLHWAAANRHVDIARELLGAGGDPHGVGDLHELDAIGWATYFHPPGGQRGERPEVASLLVERGARHHVYSAMSLGSADLLRSLVEHDPEVLDRRMSRFENSLTPVHFAIKQGRPDMVSLLIELGADLEAADGNGHTPIEAAMLAGDKESVQRLQAAGVTAPPLPPATADLSEFAGEIKRVSPMLRVSDVGRALAWYLSLGFRESGRYEERGVLYWALLSFGNAQLMLNLGSAQRDPPVVLWFYIQRATAMYEVLKARQLQAAQSTSANGIDFVQHLYEPPYGGREFAIRDPNGFQLSFLGST